MTVNKLPTVRLLGKDWIVDERLKQYRSVANPSIGEPIVFFSFQEMDDMIDTNDVLGDPDTFPFNEATAKELRTLFAEAMKGGRSAIEKIGNICHEDGGE